MISEACEVTGTNKSEGASADWFGVFCSAACAVHCAATPILLSLLPSVNSVRWLADPLFHQVVAVLCVGMVAMAILPGLRVHRNWQVGSLAGLGMVLLLSAAFVLPDVCCEQSATTDRSITEMTNVVAHADALDIQQTHEHAHIGTHSHEMHKTLVKTDAVPAAVAKTCACESDCCSVSQTLGKTLISTADLQAGFGGSLVQSLAATQPYLSPLGGMLLIIAHLLNIRLRCCGATGCGIKSSI